MAEYYWTRVWDLFASSPRTIFGFTVLAVLFATAALAPLLATHDPIAQRLPDAYQPPGIFNGERGGYLLGTDSLGRDIYSRILFSSQAAAYVAIVAAIGAAVIGVPLGLLAGYFRGRVDEGLMRVVDMWMSFPPVLLSIALIAVLGVGLQNVALALIVVDWTRFARVIRGEVLNIREKDFIAAAKAIGLSDLRIVAREVFPNIIPLLIVLLTLEMSIAITVEVLLSYVGLGVKAPNSSWGAMIAEGLAYVRTGPWGALIPMLATIIVILALNMLGDELRQRLDPRLTIPR